MTDRHIVSPEPDRRAYEALQNIHRLHSFKQQNEALQRMKDRLIQALLCRDDIRQLSTIEIVVVIDAGTAALIAGKSFTDAIAIALTTMESRPCQNQ